MGRFHRSQLRADILRRAAFEADNVFVAIFDDPTDYEEQIEQEVRLMADDGLLVELSACQFRITSAGMREMDAIELTTQGEKVTLDSRTKRSARDKLLLYIYNKGPDGMLWQVDPDVACAELNLTSQEMTAAASLIYSQGLGGDSYVGWIGINREGQREAERLGVPVAFQEPPIQSIPISNNYGIIQISGANSSLNANQTISHSTLSQVLENIERELPRLNISEQKREEAKELVEGLKNGDGFGAMKRAAAAALGSILSGAGSSLGKDLADAVGIVLSGLG